MTRGAIRTLVTLLALHAVSTPAVLGAPSENVEFLGAHSSLKEYVYQEPASVFDIGIGLVPLGVMGSKLFVGMDVFQLNWTGRLLDWEILSATIGFAFSQSGNSNSRYFILATKPKIRISNSISIGIMLGSEFVTFPNLNAYLETNRWTTPPEPFSSSSTIYGVTAAQYLKISDTKKLKISEMVFQENYSVTQSATGWNYNFSQSGAGFDRATIAPGTVFMLEVTLLF